MARSHEAYRENHFVQHEEFSASARFGKFADVSRRDRHFAAHADSLNEAISEECRKTSGEGARKAHDRHERGRGRSARNAAEPFGEPTEEQCAGKLSHVTGADEESRFSRSDVPQSNQDREGKRECQCVEGIEERRASYDNAGLGVEPRERHTLETRYERRLKHA